IQQPAQLAAAVAKSDARCHGDANGKAWVAPSGGTAPYAYSWNSSPIQNADTATGIGAGSYSVTVTDSKGCTTTASAAIAQPAVLIASTTQVNVLCHGGAS